MPTLNTNPTMLFEADETKPVTAVYWQGGESVQLIQGPESICIPIKMLCEIYREVKAKQPRAVEAMSKRM